VGDPFILITVPKGGSHLMIKTLHFLTGKVPLWHEGSLPQKIENSHFLYTHFCIDPSLEAKHNRLEKLKRIVVVRDLRDVAISMVYHVRKNVWPAMTESMRAAFKKKNFSEQLLFMIEFDYERKEALQVSLTKVAQQAAAYSKRDDVLLVRYEDLVGSLGGGSREMQLETLKKISRFLEIEIREEKLQDIAEHLYGNEVDPFKKEGFKGFASTYRSGKIGQWKEVFEPLHKAAFKKRAGNALIALGYEEGEEW